MTGGAFTSTTVLRVGRLNQNGTLSSVSAVNNIEGYVNVLFKIDSDLYCGGSQPHGISKLSNYFPPPTPIPTPILSPVPTPVTTSTPTTTSSVTESSNGFIVSFDFTLILITGLILLFV